ncbi:hypothetical protein ACFQ4K_11270 [Tistrella bauzanensis]
MLAVFGLALWVIQYETRSMSFADIRAAIAAVGIGDVVWAGYSPPCPSWR